MELSGRPVRLHVAYSWLPKRQVCSSFVYLVEQNIAWVYTVTLMALTLKGTISHVLQPFSWAF